MVSVRSFVEVPQVSVKGKLLNSIDNWKSLGAPDFILNIISRVGCKIPFISTPSRHHYRNNASAVIEADFVGDRHIAELFSSPDIINPRSVSVQSSDRKRLILDLRHVNMHVYEQKFNSEGLHTIRSAFSKEYFVFSFHLESRYHYVDIFPDHCRYPPFSWDFGSGHTRYFQFTVLPFGLSSAPFILKKLPKAC